MITKEEVILLNMVIFIKTPKLEQWTLSAIFNLKVTDLQKI